MTTINLSNLASLKAYFKTVAETHADIDGFKWGEKKVIKTANPYQKRYTKLTSKDWILPLLIFASL